MAILETVSAAQYNDNPQNYLLDWARRTGNLGSLSSYFVQTAFQLDGQQIFNLRNIADQAATPAVHGTSPQILFQFALPFVLPPSGSAANNGVVTLGSALNVQYANCYMYFPLGALYASSPAGWYFAQMSSTTVATVFANTYVSGVPQIPAVPTPLVVTGPGAYTQVTTLVATFSLTIPANAMGPNGALRITEMISQINNTNTRSFGITFGGQSIEGAANASAGSTVITTRIVRNRGVTNSQVILSGGGVGTSGLLGVAVAQLSVDTTQPVTIAGSLTLTTIATDWQVFETLLVELLSGN